MRSTPTAETCKRTTLIAAVMTAACFVGCASPPSVAPLLAAADRVLADEQRRQLSLAYKKLRHAFSKESGVAAINEHLEKQGNPVTQKSAGIVG